MKPGIKEFHNFIENEFTMQIRDSYENFEILSEADLQALAWHLLREFFAQYPTGKIYKVLNKPYFKNLGLHPDIAILRRRKPWVLMELKERKRMTVRIARRERDRLIRARMLLKPRPKRGYLIYVAPRGKEQVLHGRKEPGARYFFEVPITLDQYWVLERIHRWQREFKRWSKFVAP